MRKKAQKKINTMLTLLIAALLLPLMVTIVGQHMKLAELMAGEELLQSAGTSGGTEKAASQQEEGAGISGGTEKAASQQEDGTGTSGGTEKLTSQPEEDTDVHDGTEESGMDDEVEVRVLGILAKEISPAADREAILAQSVLARTNLCDAGKNGTAEPVGLTLSEMQTLWGEDFSKIYRRLQECVAQTGGQVLTWKGEYIYAPYHAVSAGTTRSISALYEEVTMPYLQNVSCPKDTGAEGYLGVLYWDEADFLKKCGEAFSDIKLEDADQVTVESRDAAEYVLQVRLGEVLLTGEEFRSGLGLSSACFSVTQMEDQVRIVTKGIGHGVGLSQYTAAQMAGEGKEYPEILEFFYPGTELVTIFQK